MCKVLKDAPHYLNHWSLSDGAFSTDKTRVSSTARSHGPATWAVPFPPFGPRLGAEREAVDVLPQPARHQRLQAHPTPAAASRRCCLRHRRPTRVSVPGGPSPASLPSEPRASPPARRPPHPQRRAGARSGTSGTPAGLSGPHAPGPGPLESGSSPAAPGRAHRPRSPASPPPGRTAAAAARGALARTGCRQGRGAGSAAGQEDVAVPQRDPARARPVPHRPSLRCLPKQAWPALR